MAVSVNIIDYYLAIVNRKHDKKGQMINDFTIVYISSFKLVLCSQDIYIFLSYFYHNFFLYKKIDNGLK